MDISKIELFLAAARERNFTKAAARCHVSQATISKYIAGLEKELGVPLFSRTTRTTALTAEGRQFYNGLLPLRKEWEALLSSLTAPGLHHIRLGVTDPAYSGFPLLADFRKERPAYFLYFTPAPFAVLTEQMQAGELDGILSSDAEDIPETFRTARLKTVPLVLYAAAKAIALHPPLKPLAEALPLVTRFTSPAYIHKQKERFWKSYGVVFKDTIPVSTEEEEWNAVAEGKGFSLRPKWTGPRFHGITPESLPKTFSASLLLTYPGTPSPALAELLSFIHEKSE